MSQKDNLRARVAALEEENARLRAALRPFAAVADFTERMNDDVGIWSRLSNLPGRDHVLTVGHARAARAAMLGTSTGSEVTR